MRKLTMKEMMAVSGGGCSTVYQNGSYSTVCTPVYCGYQWNPSTRTYSYVCR